VADCRIRSRRAHRLRRWIPALPHRNDRGSSTVELVLLTPVLMMLVLLVVFAGRLTQANTRVRHAADQAARAASLASAGDMEAAGYQAAMADLVDSGVACMSPTISITHTSGPGATVTSIVTCTVDRSTLAPLAPGNERIVGRSIEVIDQRRGGDAP
jgi:Flp pilus assembly protein TadG